MCHCHGRLVDRQVKHHSKMGTMPMLAVAHKTAVRRMELVAVTKIEHKSVISWRYLHHRTQPFVSDAIYLVD
jgi:hypothetical protein